MELKLKKHGLFIESHKKNKKAFIFYTGISYWKRFPHSETGLYFDLDMESSYDNHMKMLHEPLQKMGYDVDCCIITNKDNNPKYNKYIKMYKALDFTYQSNMQQWEIDVMANYFNMRFPRFGAFSFGYPVQGFRLLTIQEPIPAADIYIFCRCDLLLKKSINKINIDYNKINYLWKEEGVYRRQQENITSPYQSNSGWSICRRVSGNMLNVVPRKHIKKFLSNYWLEHCSMYAMLRDYDTLTEKDFHIVLGDQMYDSCIEREPNPIFTHNRIIVP